MQTKNQSGGQPAHLLGICNAGFLLLAWSFATWALPPLETYRFESIRTDFMIPKEWIVQTHGAAQADSAGLSIVEEADKVDSPGLYFWTGTAPYAPKEAIYIMLRESGVQTAEPIKESDLGYSYTGLLEYRYPNADMLMRGIAFAESVGGKVTWKLFEAPVERFNALGGVTLPLAVFQNLDPAMLRPDGKVVQAIRATDRVIDWNNALQLRQVNPLIWAPLGWTVTYDIFQRDYLIQQDPTNPDSALLMTRRQPMANGPVSPSKLEQALHQGLQALLVKADLKDFQVLDYQYDSEQRLLSVVANATRAAQDFKIAALSSADNQGMSSNTLLFLAPEAIYDASGGASLLAATLLGAAERGTTVDSNGETADYLIQAHRDFVAKVSVSGDSLAAMGLWLVPNFWATNTIIWQNVLGVGFGVGPSARGFR